SEYTQKSTNIDDKGIENHYNDVAKAIHKINTSRYGSNNKSIIAITKDINGFN
ncbi:19899_t:CDS:1, partial [Gigaspora margarita]